MAQAITKMSAPRGALFASGRATSEPVGVGQGARAMRKAKPRLKRLESGLEDQYPERDNLRTLVGLLREALAEPQVQEMRPDSA